jgi:hypothetical protein
MTVQDRFEKFAMHIETKSQLDQGWIDVDDAGAELALSSADSRHFADMLAQKGWATTRLYVNNKLKLRLTEPGFDEIPKLRLPQWRRWVYRNATIIIAALALIVSFASLLTSLLKK